MSTARRLNIKLNRSVDFGSWHETDHQRCPQFGRYRGESRHGVPISVANDLGCVKNVIASVTIKRGATVLYARYGRLLYPALPSYLPFGNHRFHSPCIEPKRR